MAIKSTKFLLVEILTAHCPLPINLEAKTLNSKKSVIHSIDELRCNYNLVDPWREQHQHDTQFTWRNSSGKIKCRLDFWLISKHLLCRVANTDISAYNNSDHSPVTISIKPEDIQEKRGPGYWKFKHRHAKRARVIFLVIGVFVELFTVMIWLSFGLRCTARRKLEIYNL